MSGFREFSHQYEAGRRTSGAAQCARCGAAVADAVGHDAWHEALISDLSALGVRRGVVVPSPRQDVDLGEVAWNAFDRNPPAPWQMLGAFAQSKWRAAAEAVADAVLAAHTDTKEEKP